MTLITAIIQARMSSTRLPNKVLKAILGQPMLQRQIERIKQSKLINKIIVATSTQTADDDIEQLCQTLNIDCFRGSLTDVLARYYQCTNKYPADHIVRLTADCPLTEPKIIDDVITLHLQTSSDYTSNCRWPCLPDGLDVEVFTLSALELSHQKAIKPSEREHVTQFMRNHEELFKLTDFHYKPDLSQLRWTVDEANDFEFVTQIYQYLYPQKKHFTMHDILRLLKEKPELNSINQNIIRDEGLLKSFIIDKEQGFE